MKSMGRKGLIYVLPALVIFIVFVAYPVLFNIFIGFTQWSGLGTPVWSGLENYRKIFSDRIFGTVVANFVWITGGFILLDCIFGLLLASFIQMNLIMSKAAKVIIYLPQVLAPVIIGYTFKTLLETNFGVINTLLRAIGLSGCARAWLIEPNLVRPVLLFILLWQGVGFAMVLYTAGLSAVPESVYEAADIDGVNGWQKFTRISVPMVRGTTFTLVIMNCITYIKLFDLVWVMTKGGPGSITMTFTIYVFKKAFEQYDQGISSAVATVMLIISLVLTGVQLKLYDKGRA